MGAILISIGFPILCGVFLLVRREFAGRRSLLLHTGIFLVMSVLFLLPALLGGQNTVYTVFALTRVLKVEFFVDGISVLFAVMATIIFLCTGFFAFAYMKREKHEKRYFGFFLIVLGVLYALCFAANLFTFYLFFEFLTLCSVPLVLHQQSHEAILAGCKYLFYSLSGAYMALFGFYCVYRYGNTLAFTPGGVLDGTAPVGLMLAAAFLMILGFGVKAGMFPMHAWLPTAHPIAPAPASATLSAMIVKAGVLALVRTVYFIFGVDFIKGTWVQTAWLTLTLITVFMGSVLAYREDLLKKRLAYSTVSQISYILFGLAILNETSVTGGLLQMLSHSFVKAGLFLCAGAIICQTGKTRVSQLRGIGKEMPAVMGAFTVLSLGLIGIPPTGGFVGKWYLAMGALESGIEGFAWIGPAVLLLSALLTAGYLLPVSVMGFFPGADFDKSTVKKQEPSLWMLVPIILLTVLSVGIGVWPAPVTEFIRKALAVAFEATAGAGR